LFLKLISGKDPAGIVWKLAKRGNSRCFLQRIAFYWQVDSGYGFLV